MKKLALLLVVLLVLTGCGQAKEPVPVSEIAANAALPEGYRFSDITDWGCTIHQGETQVGGIDMPDIQVNDLDQLDSEKYSPYLDSLAPEPLMIEYIAMHGGNAVSISVRITNTETEEVQNQLHYLFLKENQCYDLWLDRDLVDDELKDAIKKAVF